MTLLDIRQAEEPELRLQRCHTDCHPRLLQAFIRRYCDITDYRNKASREILPYPY